MGTSGFSYAEWKGAFYPRTIKPADMLAHYARQLPAVEINNTFYRMPRVAMLQGWQAKVPDGFRFALKVPRRITHLAGLSHESRDAVWHLWEVSAALGSSLGPFLVQLPPRMHKDVERLRGFLSNRPAGMRVALEVRNPSWLDEDTFEVLHDHGAALVAADVADPDKGAPLVPTAGFGYLRLRAESYDDAALQAHARRIAEQPWSEVYVFFKHEDEGDAPLLARRFLELLS